MFSFFFVFVGAFVGVFVAASFVFAVIVLAYSVDFEFSIFLSSGQIFDRIDHVG